MSVVVKCFAISIIASVVALVLRKKNSEYAFLVVLCAGLTMLLLVAGNIYIAVGKVSEIWQQTGIDMDQFKILLKTLGICLITQFAADTCKDFGNNSLSSGILLVGKISILIISLPLFEGVLKIVTGLISS